MKRILSFSGCAVLAALLGSGCGSISLSDQGDGSRTLIGAADFTPPSPQGLPKDASLMVRVIDQHPEAAEASSNPAMNTGLYNGQSSAPVRASALGPQILGEATVPDASAVQVQQVDSWQVPFKVPYSATDEQLRRGLNIEVRISYDGGVRYSNYNQYALTLGDLGDTHIVRVEKMR